MICLPINYFLEGAVGKKTFSTMLDITYLSAQKNKTKQVEQIHVDVKMQNIYDRRRKKIRNIQDVMGSFQFNSLGGVAVILTCSCLTCYLPS